MDMIAQFEHQRRSGIMRICPVNNVARALCALAGTKTVPTSREDSFLAVIAELGIAVEIDGEAHPS